ncbi:transcription factor bHLH [Forsythia ovata]|uniref:Transcription factor bHLH n=1 Tax=Forsythia ovata TaxID=205694 RepID=A0ABD1X9A7_9LAMI
MFPLEPSDDLFQIPSILIQEKIPESQIESGNGNKLRKIIHRDVERQRRQEMANLYSSLRTLLPPEFIKGKRSISDHMHEAVNYINHMQKNIKELKMKKEMLQKCSKSGTPSSDDGSSNNDSSNCIRVNLCQNGVEILISCSLKEKEFPLSTVLNELLEMGLNVVSCVSTKSNEKSFHRIQSEASDSRSIDLSLLQQRLANVINLG